MFPGRPVSFAKFGHTDIAFSEIAAQHGCTAAPVGGNLKFVPRKVSANDVLFKSMKWIDNWFLCKREVDIILIGLQPNA